MAQEKHPPRPLQGNPMPSHNPHAATSECIAVQQYKNLHQRHILTSTVPIQPNCFTSADVTGDDSNFNGIFQDQQMNQGLQSRLGFERKEATLPQSREPHENYFASHNAPIANYSSDSQMKELEKLFAGTSRNKPNVRSGFRSPQEASSHKQRNISWDNDILIDCMDDVSFPSISIGDISDMSAMGQPRLWPKYSVGGTIIETAEEKNTAAWIFRGLQRVQKERVVLAATSTRMCNMIMD